MRKIEGVVSNPIKQKQFTLYQFVQDRCVKSHTEAHDEYTFKLRLNVRPEQYTPELIEQVKTFIYCDQNRAQYNCSVNHVVLRFKTVNYPDDRRKRRMKRLVNAGQFTLYLRPHAKSSDIERFARALQAHLVALGVRPVDPMACDFSLAGLDNISMRLGLIGNRRLQPPAFNGTQCYLDAYRYFIEDTAAYRRYNLGQDPAFLDGQDYIQQLLYQSVVLIETRHIDCGLALQQIALRIRELQFCDIRQRDFSLSLAELIKPWETRNIKHSPVPVSEQKLLEYLQSYASVDVKHRVRLYVQLTDYQQRLTVRLKQMQARRPRLINSAAISLTESRLQLHVVKRLLKACCSLPIDSRITLSAQEYACCQEGELFKILASTYFYQQIRGASISNERPCAIM